MSAVAPATGLQIKDDSGENKVFCHLLCQVYDSVKCTVVWTAIVEDQT